MVIYQTGRTKSPFAALVFKRFCQTHWQEPAPDCVGLKHTPIPKLWQHAQSQT